MKLLRKIFGQKPASFSSSEYWTSRYEAGRNSGAGSYGHLAEHKAEVINALVKDKDISSVIEFGVGDGNQASMFEFSDYVGVDVVPSVVKNAKARFSDRKRWRFLDTEELAASDVTCEMAMSLDVIYHLVEDNVFENYMDTMFARATKYVLIYASDYEASASASHVRHRKYSDWIAKNKPLFQKIKTWDQPFPLTVDSDPNETSFAHFCLFEKTCAPSYSPSL